MVRHRSGRAIAVQPTGGQKFAAVNRCVFIDAELIPQILGGQQRRGVHRLKELGAGDVQRQCAVANHGRQIERLAIDREPVRPHADHVAAGFVQILPILQTPHRVFADRFEPRFQIARADRIAQLAQLFDDPADFVDHQVAGKIGGDRVGIVHRRCPVVDAGQNPRGRGGQRFGAAVLSFDDRDFARFERFVNLVASRRQRHDELVKLRETALQFFDLNHHLG